MAEKAIIRLKEKNLIFTGTSEEIARELNIVRFRNHKAAYLAEARNTCSREGRYSLRQILSEIPDPMEKRLWLFENIKGLGIKESSHFLRNVGFGIHFAILDRHVIRNLIRLSVLENEPKSLTYEKYLEIEQKMIRWSGEIGIPMDYLDYVLWYREAGDVFK